MPGIELSDFILTLLPVFLFLDEGWRLRGDIWLAPTHPVGILKPGSKSSSA